MSATILQVISHDCQSYPEAMLEQESIRDSMLSGSTKHVQLIFTEHPPVYTLGTSGREQDVLQRNIDGEAFERNAGNEENWHNRLRRNRHAHS